MNAGEEMVVRVLKDRYDIGLDWNQEAALVLWNSAHFGRRSNEFFPGFKISSLPS